jgi:cell wall-associated NlpC family hydrolase
MTTLDMWLPPTDFVTPGKSHSVPFQANGGVWLGEVTRYAHPVAWVKVYRLTGDHEFGPCVIVGRDWKIEDNASGDGFAKPGQIVLTTTDALPGAAATVLNTDGSVGLTGILPAPNAEAQKAVDAALSVRGAPYVWAAAGPTQFDCSGLTMWAWGKAGVTLGHFTGTQQSQTTPIKSPDEPRPGDLVFFTSPGESVAGHVGMCLGNGQMVDAPHTGAVVRVEPIAGFGGDITYGRVSGGAVAGG